MDKMNANYDKTLKEFRQVRIYVNCLNENLSNFSSKILRSKIKNVRNINVKI